MGSTIKVVCNKCGYSNQFFVGFGFNDCAEWIFYKNMPLLRKMVKSPQERIHIRNIMIAHPDAKVISSEHCIYHCSYCGNLDEHYYFKICYQQQQYFPNYYCSRCETKMERLDTNWFSMCTSEPVQFYLTDKGQAVIPSCPNCGDDNLNCFDGCFDWD